MGLAELQKLIAASKGEWEHIEFKKTTGELKGGMETLCAFLNGVGVKVLFGVTNAGKIQGQDMADATYQEVANAIRRLEPPASIEQIRIPVAGTKEVLILETTQQTDGPYTFDGRPYQRIGNTTSRMPQTEYQRRLLASAPAKYRWENQVADGYSVSDLDVEEIDRAVRAAIHCGRLESQASDPLDALDRLQLRVDGQLLTAAVVLVGQKFEQARCRGKMVVATRLAIVRKSCGNSAGIVRPLRGGRRREPRPARCSPRWFRGGRAESLATQSSANGRARKYFQNKILEIFLSPFSIYTRDQD
jgi:predicted HTH transcriptional regulator